MEVWLFCKCGNDSTRHYHTPSRPPACSQPCCGLQRGKTIINNSQVHTYYKLSSCCSTAMWLIQCRLCIALNVNELLHNIWNCTRLWRTASIDVNLSLKRPCQPRTKSKGLELRHLPRQWAYKWMHCCIANHARHYAFEQGLQSPDCALALNFSDCTVCTTQKGLSGCVTLVCRLVSRLHAWMNVMICQRIQRRFTPTPPPRITPQDEAVRNETTTFAWGSLPNCSSLPMYIFIKKLVRSLIRWLWVGYCTTESWIVVIPISHAHFSLRGGVCSPPFSSTSRLSDKQYLSLPSDEAPERANRSPFICQCEVRWLQFDIDLWSQSVRRWISSIHMTLRFLRSKSWDTAWPPFTYIYTCVTSRYE